MEAISSYHDLVRHDALSFLPPQLGRVLDFGGGIGATAAALRGAGRADHAVLFDQVADKALAEIDAAEAVDFEDLEKLGELAGRHGPFDTILALDVLEHLRDPWAVIAVLETALKPGGPILVSVPNVSSSVVLLPLLFHDSFEYTRSGVLDRTHLRWFTRKSAIKLAQAGGLVVQRVRTNPFPRRKILLDKLTLGLLTRFIAMQWLVLVRKPG
ncbi:MAG: methyltransferase domain-containing protein [Sphingomonadales bacterium]|nr:methyltransferase domain-containing protein [Sphingomonadales bacterium]